MIMYKKILLYVCICISTLLIANREARTIDSDTQSSSSTSPDAGQLYQDGSAEKPSEPLGRTSISVASNLVTLQVLVTDEKGNVITGLKPGNFTVYEDKVKQEISNFSPIEANITAVLLIEQTKRSSYSLDQHFIGQIYNIMTTFVKNLRQGDWIGVIGYDIKPTILCDFTQDHREVLETFNSLRYPAIRESNLFDAVFDTLDRTQEMDGKVAIILVSTGYNSFSAHTYDDVLKKCRSAKAVIYAIGMGQYYRLLLEAYGYSSALDRMDGLMADNQLKYISEYTGGASYLPRHDTELPAIVQNISTLLRSQYSIGYVSTNTKTDGKFRKIKVEVQADMKVDGKQVKFKVKTREGYIPRPR
ncbi:MAG: VWA domain-containing protein [Acidobacteriota bacterium]